MASAQGLLRIERQRAVVDLSPSVAASLFKIGENRAGCAANQETFPGWAVTRSDGTLLGYVGSTWEIARSGGYSGRPIEMLVAVSPQGRIEAAELVASCRASFDAGSFR